MVNGMTPWGNWNLVPHGTLREPLDALKRADIGVIHHADLVSTPIIVDSFSVWAFSRFIS